MALLCFMLFSSLCSLFLVIAHAERINSLPGQPEKVNFKQFSGNIVSDEHYGRSLFYYFVGAQSNQPLKLPLTFWLGGGM
ncbi:hypothetical protein DM860_006194 [Cuscuta australis]|uniref:Uncharacterized protein n=1 Tax=Cuscuta australis TaxID=267555 RepID=A0A328DL98_9ASTE|nr:hypothetical protein DM860_006194 [Cuscuta australis]